MAVFLASMTVYHTARKHGIVLRRWSMQQQPQDAVSWISNSQKWVSMGRHEKKLFNDDPPFRDLLSQIYRDRRYDLSGHRYISQSED